MENEHTGFLGLDAGSTAIKMVGLDQAGNITWKRIEKTGPKLTEQLNSMISDALKRSGSSNLPVGVTGYGRHLVNSPARIITEITCHAKGAFQTFRHGGTLIDIGGQDTKVIIMEDDGKVADFSMNDKCAAGTGRFLEVCAERLGFSLSEFSDAALDASGEVQITNTCTVFAESEIISLIARGHDVRKIVRGVFRSMLRRITGLAKSTGIRQPVMLSGGVAESPAARLLLAEELMNGPGILNSLGRSRSMKEELETMVSVPEQPQFMGAYGAALIVMDNTCGKDNAEE